ncbi:MAG: uroporphyrinogen decarboxylase family protein [Lentisphaeria bacterium]
MAELTGRERIARQLQHLPVDHIGVFEAFWQYTMRNWKKQGKVPPNTYPGEHFGLDMQLCNPCNMRIDPQAQDRLISEDEDTITLLDGNGATFRRHKKHDSTPEHIDFTIKEREQWLDLAKPFLTADASKRLNFSAYRDARKTAADKGFFFCWAGVNVFELMHPICGHQNMLMGMALDPEWIHDMVNTYSELIVHLQEELFAAEGKPDGIWYWEDMGFKGRPFMSPTMYQELIMPAHQKTIAYAHSLGLPVIMHSCGFVEPLLPHMVAAGIDALQAMEVKAGMDLLRIYQQFGEKIALIGGLDVRPIANNDLPGIKRELESKIPFVKQHNAFILHSDHSIPESTEYETYLYFKETGLKLGTY